MNGPSKESILAALEDVLRTQPAEGTIRHNTPEVRQWIGRAVAAISAWDAALGTQASTHARFLRGGTGREAFENGQMLIDVLYVAHSSARLHTIGSVNTAIGGGRVFDYFDEIRKIIETANKDLFFIDPYLDAEFVSRYLAHARAGTTIRLLGRERMATLLPAATAFAQQTQTSLEIRSALRFHDRYLIADGASCYQSGASFKDGARNAPTTDHSSRGCICSRPGHLRSHVECWETSIPLMVVPSLAERRSKSIFSSLAPSLGPPRDAYLSSDRMRVCAQRFPREICSTAPF
jgi:hypothetical protein